MTSAQSNRAVDILKYSFIHATKEGGLPWGCAYLVTLAWIDLALVINKTTWKNEVIDLGFSLVAIPIGSLLLFVMLLNMLDGNASMYKLAKRTWLVAISSLASSAIVILGLLLFVVPGIIFAKWYFYAPYLAARHSIGPLESMKRSKRLSRINGWSSLSIWVLLTGLVAALSFGIDQLIVLRPSFFNSYGSWYALGPGVVFFSQFTSSWVSSILLPVFACFMCINAEQRVAQSQLPSDSSPRVNMGAISGSSREQHLKELRDLLQKGLIDEDEYRDAKRKELGL
jgi:hypothetical protein